MSENKETNHAAVIAPVETIQPPVRTSSDGYYDPSTHAEGEPEKGPVVPNASQPVAAEMMVLERTATKSEGEGEGEPEVRQMSGCCACIVACCMAPIACCACCFSSCF